MANLPLMQRNQKCVRGGNFARETKRKMKFRGLLIYEKET